MDQHQKTQDELAANLRNLIDKEAIPYLISKYARACDRADRPMQRTCYHPGTVNNHGLYNGLAEDFIEIGHASLAQWAECTTHHLGSSLIEVDGDIESAETYVRGMMRGALPGQTERADVTVAGRYVDRFERRDGKWFIAERTFLFDWSRVDPIDRIFPPPEGTTVGIYGTEDVSYSLLASYAAAKARPQ